MEKKHFKMAAALATLNFQSLQYACVSKLLLPLSKFRVNRTRWLWDLPEKDFQCVVRPQYWICCDVIYCIREL